MFHGVLSDMAIGKVVFISKDIKSHSFIFHFGIDRCLRAVDTK